MVPLSIDLLEVLSSGVLYKEGAEVQASDNPDTAVKSGPTKLSDMKIVATEGGFVSKACEDSLGNTYKNVPVIYKWTYDNIYSKYYLTKGHSKLSFDVSCYENEEIHANYNFIFRVYGDDPKNPIYSLNVNRSLPLTHVDLDVSGVEFLTFSVENDPSGNTTKGVVLSSAMLE